MKFIRLLIILALRRCQVAWNSLFLVILHRFWGLSGLVGRRKLVFIDIIKVDLSILFCLRIVVLLKKIIPFRFRELFFYGRRAFDVVFGLIELVSVFLDEVFSSRISIGT